MPHAKVRNVYLFLALLCDFDETFPPPVHFRPGISAVVRIPFVQLPAVRAHLILFDAQSIPLTTVRFLCSVPVLTPREGLPRVPRPSPRRQGRLGLSLSQTQVEEEYRRAIDEQVSGYREDTLDAASRPY